MRRISDLATATDPVLYCRSHSHAWYHTKDTDLVWHRAVLVSFMHYESCVRCNASRRRRVELSRSVIGRASIQYPDGYLAAKGHHFSRLDAFTELYARAYARATSRPKTRENK